VKFKAAVERTGDFAKEEIEEKRSADLLATWANRTGLNLEFMRREMVESRELDADVSERMFNHWFSDSRVTAKKSDRKLVGERVVAIVEYLARNRQVRVNPIILPAELEEFIGLYTFLPAEYRLQLRRLLYEIQVEFGQKYTDVFSAKDWRKLFTEWNAFAFVTDQFYCIRAYSRYNMELAGLKEEDAKNWYWWQRLALGARGKSKFAGQNTLFSLRGVYADEYYTQQMLRFLLAI
jgi:hypothetical protein